MPAEMGPAAPGSATHSHVSQSQVTPEFPPTWYRVLDVAGTAVDSLLEALRARGVETIPAEQAGAGGLGLLFFSEISPSLLSLVQELRSRQSMVLCVAVGADRLPSAGVWQLLGAGARDVLAASAR